MRVNTVIVVVILEQIVIIIVNTVLLGMVVHLPLNVLAWILPTCPNKTAAMLPKFSVFETTQRKKKKGTTPLKKKRKNNLKKWNIQCVNYFSFCSVECGFNKEENNYFCQEFV